MTWLHKAVQTSRLKRLGLCGLILTGIGGVIAFNYRYLDNVQQGPYHVPRAELIAAASADDMPRYWVNLTVDKILDTGVDQITVRKRRGVETGRSVSGHYYAGVLGDRLLLIKTHGEALGGALGSAPLKGAILTPPADLIGQLSGTNAKVKAAFLPVMLDTERFESNAETGLGIAAAIAAITLLFALFTLNRYLRPGGHKALKALETSGERLDLAGQSISGDINAREYVRLKDYRLTSRYALKDGLGFDVKPLRELLWAYPTVTQHKIYGIIPSGKSYGINLTFKDATVTQKIGQGVSEKAVQHLARWSPWTFFGYSDQLDDAMKRQRAEVVAAVEARYASVMTAAASGPASATPNAGGGAGPSSA